MVIQPPFTKRAVLDDGPQLLEQVLVALDSAYNDRRAPASCVPGALDKVYTASGHKDPTPSHVERDLLLAYDSAASQDDWAAAKCVRSEK